MNIYFILFCLTITLSGNLIAMEEGQEVRRAINIAANNNNAISLLQQLPEELFLHCTQYLDQRSLAALTCVCRLYNQIISHEPNLLSALVAHRNTIILQRQRAREREEHDRDIRRNCIGCRSYY